MKETTGPQQHKTSLLMGVLFLLLVTILPACGPGPEEPDAAGELNAAQGEPTFELARGEREHGPISSTQ